MGILTGYAPTIAGWVPHLVAFVVWVGLLSALSARVTTDSKGRPLPPTRRGAPVLSGETRLLVTALVIAIPTALVAHAVYHVVTAPSKEYVVLLAGVDTSDPQDTHGFELELRARLLELAESSDEVRVLTTDEVLGADGGEEGAVALGKRYGADLVLWGSFREPGRGTPKARASVTLNVTPSSARFRDQDSYEDSLVPLPVFGGKADLELSVPIAELAQLGPQTFLAEDIDHVVSAGIGSVMVRAGQYREAHEVLERALVGAPRDTDLLTLTSFAYRCCGDYEEGRQNAEEAFSLDGSASNAITLGRFALDAAEYRWAVTLFAYAHTRFLRRIDEYGLNPAARDMVAMYERRTGQLTQLMAYTFYKAGVDQLDSQFDRARVTPDDLEEVVEKAVAGSPLGRSLFAAASDSVAHAAHDRAFSALVMGGAYADQSIEYNPSDPNGYVIAAAIDAAIANSQGFHDTWGAFRNAMWTYRDRESRSAWAEAKRTLDTIHRHFGDFKRLVPVPDENNQVNVEWEWAKAVFFSNPPIPDADSLVVIEPAAGGD